jgi:CRP-like cAMP-binding protein
MLDLVERALALRAAPLFGPLTAEELLPVAELCTEVELAAGALLFSQGELGDSLYVVVSGGVLAVRDGKELARLGAGECVGELAALDWEPRSATVTAVEPTKLIRLERDDLFDLLGDHPELVRALAGVLVARIRARRAPS